MRPLGAPEAARLIIRGGVESDSYQIFVGKDSSLMSMLSRINPTYAAKLIARRMREGAAQAGRAGRETN